MKIPRQEQMKELNPVIRTAVLRALLVRFAKVAEDGEPKNKEDKRILSSVNFLIKMIPSYWEIPSETELGKTLLEDI